MASHSHVLVYHSPLQITTLSEWLAIDPDSLRCNWDVATVKPHRIHVWYSYLHLVYFDGKCRQIYQTWILWEQDYEIVNLPTGFWEQDQYPCGNITSAFTHKHLDMSSCSCESNTSGGNQFLICSSFSR